MPIKPEHHFQIWYVFLAVLALLVFEDYLAAVGTATRTIPYSQFQDMLAQGKLDDLVVDTDRISGDFKNPAAGKPAHFDTVRVDPALAQSLGRAGATFAGAPPPGWLSRAIAWLAPIALFWAVWLFVGQRLSGGLGSRPDGHRAQPRARLRRDGDQDDVRGRRWPRRSEERAAGGC